jgi:hypothetical protein
MVQRDMAGRNMAWHVRFMTVPHGVPQHQVMPRHVLQHHVALHQS